MSSIYVLGLAQSEWIVSDKYDCHRLSEVPHRSIWCHRMKTAAAI